MAQRSSETLKPLGICARGLLKLRPGSCQRVLLRELLVQVPSQVLQQCLLGSGLPQGCRFLLPGTLRYTLCCRQLRLRTA